MKKKENITHHGLLHDTVNMKVLIETQAKTPSFLDSPKEYSSKTKGNYGTSPKKLTLTPKKSNRIK